MTRSALAPLPLSPIRALWFDGWLVIGCTVLALFAGYFARAFPNDADIFGAILAADVWLLGSHHVVATYTRLCFDKESFKENRFFVLGLPWLVFLGILAAMWVSGGRLIISTIYLYWQWFHYTRQSYGIARIYGRKAPLPAFDEKLTAWVIYTVPLWGILFISQRHHRVPNEKFLGSPYWTFNVPDWLLWGAGLLAAGCVALWLVRALGRYVDRSLSILPTLYLLSHVVIFVVGYYVLGSIHINLGWLVINIWHNAQYILIVWLYNNNRFKDGIDPNAYFLSYISQVKFLWLYFGICLGLTAVFYGIVEFFSNNVAPNYLPNLITDGGWAVVAYQGINFHHYIVDGYIWKVRKKRTRERLGIKEDEDSTKAEVAKLVDG